MINTFQEIIEMLSTNDQTKTSGTLLKTQSTSSLASNSSKASDFKSDFSTFYQSFNQKFEDIKPKNSMKAPKSGNLFKSQNHEVSQAEKFIKKFDKENSMQLANIDFGSTKNFNSTMNNNDNLFKSRNLNRTDISDNLYYSPSNIGTSFLDNLVESKPCFNPSTLKLGSPFLGSNNTHPF